MNYSDVIDFFVKGIPYILIFETILIIFLLIILHKMYKDKKKNNRHYFNTIKNQEIFPTENNCKVMKIHILYIVFIATLIIIILLTRDLEKSDEFGRQLAFAGTVSSIILSILAIFMSIIGEGKAEALKNQIEVSKDDLTKAITELKKMMDDISSMTKRIEEMKSQLDHMDKNVEEIKNTNPATTYNINENSSNTDDAEIWSKNSKQIGEDIKHE